MLTIFYMLLIYDILMYLLMHLTIIIINMLLFLTFICFLYLNILISFSHHQLLCFYCQLILLAMFQLHHKKTSGHISGLAL